MSAGNPESFPWGSNNPTRNERGLVALVIGVLATLALLLRFVYRPTDPVDFDQIWFAARMLLEGRDPYPLVGPDGLFHWNFPLLYPAPSIVLAMPLALMSKHAAALAFVFIGSTLLGFALTVDGWHKLPIFVSAAFLDTTMGAQWSSLLIAGLFIPSLAAVACAKPQLGLAILAGNTSSRSMIAAAVGAIILLALSFLLVPHWVGEWLALVASADHMKAALFQPGGVLIALVLLRWRRFESWVVLLTAVLPQTLMWYSFLVLLAFPRTYHEACALSLISTTGYLLAHLVGTTLPPVERTGQIIWGIVVFTTFLPVVVAILRRPNHGSEPAWMSILSGARLNFQRAPAPR